MANVHITGGVVVVGVVRVVLIVVVVFVIVVVVVAVVVSTWLDKHKARFPFKCNRFVACVACVA